MQGMKHMTLGMKRSYKRKKAREIRKGVSSRKTKISLKMLKLTKLKAKRKIRVMDQQMRKIFKISLMIILRE